MYKVKRVDGQYLAINNKNVSDMYYIPDAIARRLMQNGNMEMEDIYFNNLRQNCSEIVPYVIFDNLNKTHLSVSRDVVKNSHDAEKKLSEKRKKGEEVKVRRDVMIKKAAIKVAIGFTSAILAISGGISLKKKIHKKPTNDYTTEKNIDNNDTNIHEEDNYIVSDYVNEDLTDDSYDNTLVKEDTTNLDEQEDSTEYYYNLDGEVDEKNWENAMKYEKEFREAEKIFGIDHRLLMAIACQESSGIHDPDNDKYAKGIMQIEPVHFMNKDKNEEILYFYNHVTKKQDSVKINKDNVYNVKTNILIGAGLYQHDCYLAIEKGYDKSLLKSQEVIPAGFFGYNNGPTAEVRALNDYKESGEESYNSFIRTTISANIDDEDLVWHWKYPALVLNECNEKDAELWVKDSRGRKFVTKPINESKIYSASMKR